MSNINYTQYSKQPEVTEEEVAVNQSEVKMEQFEVPVVETPAVESPKPKTVTGVVANCAKLNVRTKPDITASVACVILAGDAVTIDDEKSTKEWYSVCTTNGVDGYCMRKFISVE